MKDLLNKVYLSIETTGLEPDNFEIIEIAALKIDEFNNKSLFHRLIRPQQALTSSAEAITNLKNSDLIEQKSFEKIKIEFLDFLGELPVVLNNQKFIEGFLNKQIGDELSNTKIDLNEMFNEKFPNESSSLESMLTQFDLRIDTGFTASLNEVLILPRIYEKLSGH